MITGESMAIIPASESRLFSPPERACVFRFPKTLYSKPVNSMEEATFSLSFFPARPLLIGPKATSSAAKFSNKALSASCKAKTGRSVARTSPDCGSSKPEAISKRVDLPPPLFPMMAVRLPFLKEREKSLYNGFSPG